MRRQSLRIIIVLGVLVTFVGGTGIFAVFSDRATAGENNVASGTRARAADLLIERGEDFGGEFINCDTNADAFFGTDDISDPQFTSAGLQPGGTLAPAYLCLRNAGASALTVTARAIDLVDLDLGCTGDEAAAGDNDCAVVAGTPGAGELSPLLFVTIEAIGCEQIAGQWMVLSTATSSLYALTQQPVGVGGGSLGPGQHCVRLTLAYPSDGLETTAQIAQSDQATWRFAFDGTAD